MLRLGRLSNRTGAARTPTWVHVLTWESREPFRSFRKITTQPAPRTMGAGSPCRTAAWRSRRVLRSRAPPAYQPGRRWNCMLTRPCQWEPSVAAGSGGVAGDWRPAAGASGRPAATVALAARAGTTSCAPRASCCSAASRAWRREDPSPLVGRRAGCTASRARCCWAAPSGRGAWRRRRRGRCRRT